MKWSSKILEATMAAGVIVTIKSPTRISWACSKQAKQELRLAKEDKEFSAEGEKEIAIQDCIDPEKCRKPLHGIVGIYIPW